MTAKRLGAIALLALVIALAIYVFSGKTHPHADNPPPSSPTATTASSPHPAAHPQHHPSVPGHTLTPTERQRLRAAIAHARATRAAAAGAAATAPQPNPRPHLDSPSTVLSIKDKTGDNSAWEKRALGVLNQLLGECYDLARTDDPTLSGNVTLLFTISAEPDIGGLVDNIHFDETGTTIASPDLRQCMRQSLHALELDPPPTGLTIDRQLTLTLGGG